jgi:hypothetical protein
MTSWVLSARALEYLRARPTYSGEMCSICGATVRGYDDEGWHTMWHDLLVALLDREAVGGCEDFGRLGPAAKSRSP